MAQAGYTPIQLYYSTTASAAPSSGNLANGELALNITDGKLYYKDNGGTVQVLATKAGASGDVVGPGSSTDNALVRFDGTTGKLVQNSAGILDDSGNLTGLAAVTMSGALTLSGGTANGVAYLNGSKVLTTGSALTFDGTNLGVGGSVNTGANRAAITANGANEGIVSLAVAGSSKAYWYADGGIVQFGSQASIPVSFLYGGSEGMRLTSTGLGIGTSSPAVKLDVLGSVKIAASNGSGDLTIGTSSGAAQYQYITFGGSTAGQDGWQIGRSSTSSGLGGNGAFYIYDIKGNTTRMSIDTSGNLGLGVTPSAWYTGGKAIQLLNNGIFSVPSTEINVLSNAYLNAGASAWIYQSSNAASRYQQIDSAHKWYTAPSGTAGNAISFTQAMTLDASGNLGVQNTNTGGWLYSGVSAGSGSGDAAFTTYSGASNYGGIAFARSTSGTARYAGLIQYLHSNDSMQFYTASTERARIDSSGSLLVGATSKTASETLKIVGAGSSGGEVARFENSTNTSGYSGIVSSIQQNGNNTSTWHFRGNTNNVANWYLYGNGTISYSSDARLKKNIETTRDGYLEDLCKLRVVKYNWRNDAEDKPKELGLLAQEVEQVFAGLVQDDPNKISKDDDTVYKQLKGSVLPFMLLKAIQEQQAIIEQLKADVAALKGA